MFLYTEMGLGKRMFRKWFLSNLTYHFICCYVTLVFVLACNSFISAPYTIHYFSSILVLLVPCDSCFPVCFYFQTFLTKKKILLNELSVNISRLPAVAFKKVLFLLFCKCMSYVLLKNT